MRNKLPRGLELALAVSALLWAMAAAAIARRSAHGLAGRLQLPNLEALLGSSALIFLLVLGFQLLNWISTRRGERVDEPLLPRRFGWTSEWGLGAAVGWAACLAIALPVLLSGHLHGHLVFGSRRPADLVLAVLAVLAATLAEELIFRGYPFLRLSAALGPSFAAVCTSLAFATALLWGHPSHGLFLPVLNSALLGLLLTLSYLRTHALWMAWGLHFSYRGAMLVLLGLTSAGDSSTDSVLDTFMTGPVWLTGGRFGLDGALLTAPVLLLASALLYRLTREYAWHYTFHPVIGAGYPVAVPPPKAHTAMEQAAGPPPLVQILPNTAEGRSAPPPPAMQDIKPR